MITMVISEQVKSCNADGCGRRLRKEYYGKAADTKPTDGVENADIFYEMDTGTVFLFDEENQEWLKQ